MLKSLCAESDFQLTKVSDGDSKKSLDRSFVRAFYFSILRIPCIIPSLRKLNIRLFSINSIKFSPHVVPFRKRWPLAFTEYCKTFKNRMWPHTLLIMYIKNSGRPNAALVRTRYNKIVAMREDMQNLPRISHLTHLLDKRTIFPLSPFFFSFFRLYYIY